MKEKQQSKLIYIKVLVVVGIGIALHTIISRIISEENLINPRSYPLYQNEFNGQGLFITSKFESGHLKAIR